MLAAASRAALVAARTQATRGSRKMSGLTVSPKELVQRKKSSFDDLPMPSEPWAAFQGQRTSKWNMFLGANILLLIGTVYAMYAFDTVILSPKPNYKAIKIDPASIDPVKFK